MCDVTVVGVELEEWKALQKDGQGAALRGRAQVRSSAAHATQRHSPERNAAAEIAR